ncbi:MAG: YqeG family HAD IIIA-type phosphatase [Actinobacteria bacterium]|nr:MAG: YqeG family HAD IIIA-type phosphatase [Actinomycetota bacterium]
MIKWLTPDAYYDSIYAINIDDLSKQGIEGIIIDLDNTLIPRDKKDTPSRLIEWLDNIEKNDLRLCVVSNNKHSRGKAISEKINRPVVSMARKPSRSAFKKALDILKTPEDKTVVIGDQIFTDVMGGRRMGLKTILVVPLKGKDFFTTALIRRLEWRILRRLIKDNRLQKNKGLQLR